MGHKPKPNTLSVKQGKTIIEIDQLNTSDLLDERNQFLIFNNEDGKTHRVSDLQMDARFLSANNLYAVGLSEVMQKVSSFPIAVTAGNDIVLNWGEFSQYTSLAARIELMDYDSGEVNSYRFSYMISQGVVNSLEFVWHESHQHVEKGTTPWTLSNEGGSLTLRIGTQNVPGQSPPSIMISISDVSLGL